MGQLHSIVNVHVRYKIKGATEIQSIPFNYDTSTLNETNLDISIANLNPLYDALQEDKVEYIECVNMTVKNKESDGNLFFNPNYDFSKRKALLEDRLGNIHRLIERKAYRFVTKNTSRIELDSKCQIYKDEIQKNFDQMLRYLKIYTEFT